MLTTPDFRMLGHQLMKAREHRLPCAQTILEDRPSDGPEAGPDHDQPGEGVHSVHAYSIVECRPNDTGDVGAVVVLPAGGEVGLKDQIGMGVSFRGGVRETGVENADNCRCARSADGVIEVPHGRRTDQFEAPVRAARRGFPGPRGRRAVVRLRNHAGSDENVLHDVLHHGVLPEVIDERGHFGVAGGRYAQDQDAFDLCGHAGQSSDDLRADLVQNGVGLRDGRIQCERKQQRVERDGHARQLGVIVAVVLGPGCELDLGHRFGRRPVSFAGERRHRELYVPAIAIHHLTVDLGHDCHCNHANE